MENTLQKYVALLEIVDTGSFTKAAETLSYTQSGISRMVAELEHAWGIKLLERGRGGAIPTSEGAQLIPYIRDVCSRQRNLQMEIDNITGLKSGLIRIATFASVAAQWLPEIIKGFQHDYPGIDYDLMIGTYSEITEWLLSGRADCGFLMLPTLSSFETTSLGFDNLMAVLPLDHPLARLKRVPIQKLEGEGFLLDEKIDDRVVANLLDEYEVHPNINLTTPDDYVIMSMVESGLGISILPELILERNPYKVAIRPLDVNAVREIGFAVKSIEGATRAVRTFKDYLDIWRRKNNRD